MSDKVLPLHEEQLHVTTKATVGITTIKTRTETREEEISLPLTSTEVQVERVPIDEIVETAPSVRQEGNIMIIPVYEEVIVKRIRIIEEVRITKEEKNRDFKDQVTLRKEVIDILTKKEQTDDN